MFIKNTCKNRREKILTSMYSKLERLENVTNTKRTLKILRKCLPHRFCHYSNQQYYNSQLK